jgi:hypothetical protein
MTLRETLIRDVHLVGTVTVAHVLLRHLVRDALDFTEIGDCLPMQPINQLISEALFIDIHAGSGLLGLLLIPDQLLHPPVCKLV